jgi:exodeoxyribonuclease V alpha subunit
MTQLAMLERLQRWRHAGWLRALDLALARFLHELDEDTPASLLLAASLLAHLEGRGHSCLPLAAVARDPNGILVWPVAAAQELGEALESWPTDDSAARAAWGAIDTLQFEPGDDGGSSPLVLCGGDRKSVV